MAKEVIKRKFQVMARPHPDGFIEKDIFIDGVKLDYSIDISAFREATKMGPLYKQAVQTDIVRHFTKCVSEFIGRHVTLEDIKEAIKTGWI